MHQVNIHEAKTQLSKLIQEALDGEEVIIARNSQPLVRLEVLQSVKKQRRIGGLKGVVIKISDDFDAPLDDLADYAE